MLVCYGKELKEGFVNYGELFSSLGKVKQKKEKKILFFIRNLFIFAQVE